MNKDLQELMECVSMMTAIGFGVKPKDAEAALPEIMQACMELISYEKVAAIVDAKAHIQGPAA